MFVIIGANGNTGRVAAESLIADRQPVRVVVRDDRQADAWRAKGAEVAKGSLEDVASLAAAFDGARGVYLLAPPDPGSGDLLAGARRQIGNAVTALTRAEVPHVVLLSSIGAEHAYGNGPIASLHEAEQTLSQVPGLGRTFLRSAYFLDNHAAVLGVAKEHGVLPTFLPADSVFPQIGTPDVGRAAARALVEPAPAGTTRVWNLAGAADVSEREVAAALGAILGKEIQLVVNPLDAVVPTFTSFGISAHVAGLYREMYAAIASGHVAFAPGAQVIRGQEGAREALARLIA